MSCAYYSHFISSHTHLTHTSYSKPQHERGAEGRESEGIRRLTGCLGKGSLRSGFGKLIVVWFAIHFTAISIISSLLSNALTELVPLIPAPSIAARMMVWSTDAANIIDVGGGVADEGLGKSFYSYVFLFLTNPTSNVCEFALLLVG